MIASGLNADMMYLKQVLKRKIKKHIFMDISKLIMFKIEESLKPFYFKTISSEYQNDKTKPPNVGHHFIF